MLIFLAELAQRFLPESYRALHAAIFSGQEFCGTILPNSQYIELNRALVCGVDLPPGEVKDLLIGSGLIHLMVVSGSHLVFWEELLFFLPRRVRLAWLTIYAYLTGFQPPVVLALVRRWVAPHLNRRYGFTSLQTEAAAVLAVLIFLPSWILSRSFLMSWGCAVALTSPAWLKGRRFLDPSLKVYFFLWPFCAGGPLTILWNACLAPFVGLALFPAKLFSLIVRPLDGLTDRLWWIFLEILKAAPPGESTGIFISSAWLWPWPLLLHLLFLEGEIRWRRASAYSCS
jgi:hypothetical protein